MTARQDELGTSPGVWAPVSYFKSQNDRLSSNRAGRYGWRFRLLGADVLGKAMTTMRDSIRGVVAETERLTHSATAGKLDVRGDAGRFQGAFAEIVTGLNDTLDAVTSS